MEDEDRAGEGRVCQHTHGEFCKGGIRVPSGTEVLADNGMGTTGEGQITRG